MAEKAPEKKSMIQEFMNFLQTFGVIGLAIAFIVGQAASKVVSALVNDLVTPFIGLFLHETGDLKGLEFAIGDSKFMYGDLIATVIDFMVIAFIVFLAYKQLSKYRLVEDKTKPK